MVRERRLRRNAERLAAALLETILFAIDVNDAETGAHVRRVARYALVLADAAGLNYGQQLSVERVALFHDIGKIHWALNDLLHDTGKLTPEERSAIATHPARGADVLAPLAAFYPELPAGVLSHHERWDGSGYPHKLRGLDIPLTSRIVAVADSFDVVSHGREYSAKRTLEAARAEIAEGHGTQFDPALTDLFLSDDVMTHVEVILRESRRFSRPPADDRRDDHRAHPVADITFRWRSEAPALLRRGLTLRKPTG